MHPLNLRASLWLVVMLLFWAFYGMTGRSAWQPDEVLAFGDLIAWQSAGGMPSAAGSPLYTLVAGFTAWVTQPWLDLQDGARLASSLFIVLALLFTGLSAREFFGPGYGPAAALALMGAFGLMLRAHAFLPGVALMPLYALLLYGVALARRRPKHGAVAIAMALALLPLARGYLDLLAGSLMVILPLLSRDWRERTSLRALAYGLSGAASLLAIWFALLAVMGNGAFAAGVHQFTRFPEWARNPGAVLNVLGWFAWPIWPLAAWSVWNQHRRLGRESALHPALAATLVLLLLAMWPAGSRDGGLLPILVPLSLLAVHGLDSLRRGAAQSFYWFGVLCFLFFAVAFWVYFAGLEWGWPRAIAAHMQRLMPEYQPGVTAASIWIAAVATALWLITTPLFPRAKLRPVLVWSTGMLLTWVLLMSLFRPWAETGWGYGPLTKGIAASLPAGACVRADVDPAMEIQLRQYFAERPELKLFLAATPEPACDYQLRMLERRAIARAVTQRSPPLANEPELVWQGHRPRNKEMVYRLYHDD